MEKPYRLPDPEKNPEVFLVLLYKTLKRIEFDNREWDKIYFPRCMKRTKQLLECLKNDVRKAARCMQDLKDRFEGDGLSWTIETVIQYCFEWRSEFDKISDRQTLRGLATAYAGSGVENLIKKGDPERIVPRIAEAELSEEERIGALQEIEKCRQVLAAGAKTV